jgi:RecA/RadA recombinase
VEQKAAAGGQAQQAVVASGTLNAYFGDRERPGEPAVSVAPPVGQRDEQLPLRGRDQILAKITGSGARVWVVYGLGGCGKTRLALEAAFQAQQDGVAVWWVSAADPASLMAGMRAVGRRLGVSDTQLEHGDATDVIWQYLASRADRWLLVVDNADDPQVLAGAGRSVAEGRGWLRPVPGQAGRVLVTSRDGRATIWGAWCQRHRLGVLPPEQAAAVLADHAGHHPDLGSEGDARRLAVRLGGLPLALKIAGAYLADAAATPPVFAEAGQIRSYRHYQQAIDSGDFDTVFPAAGQDMTQEQARELIGRTWDLTLDLLEAQQMPEARPLLRLLAGFADAPLPYQMVLHPASLAASPLFAGMTGPRLWQVIKTLDDSGLLDLAASGNDPGAIPVVRLHPLVRDTSRLSTPPADRLAFLRLAAGLVRRAADQTGLPNDPASWPAWQLIAPHAAYLLATLDPQSGSPDDAASDTSHVAHLAALYWAEQGLYAQAEDQFRDVLAAELRVLGADHPDTLTARHEIARMMAARGDHAGAEAEYRDVLAARLRVQGPDHPYMLYTRHEIARMMAAQGNYAGAEAEHRDILAAKLRVLGPDHSSTLVTRHEITRTMAERGDHAGAEAEHRDVLATELRVLGPDHPSTLITRYAVAFEMGARGDHAGAEAEYRDVLAAELRVLGPDHPSTLTTRHEIARMIAAQGDHAGAEAEYRDVLADKVRVLGPDHPSTKATASWLPGPKP